MKVKKIVCKICGKKDIKSKAGLTSHIRYNHPEEFARLYPAKAKKAEAKKVKAEKAKTKKTEVKEIKK